MFRFICFLLGKQYESCKSCETLRMQLAITNEEKRDLTDTLLGLLKPQVQEVPVREIQPIQPRAALWSRRKAFLEEQDRIKSRIVSESPNVAKPDTKVEELEIELGVEVGEKSNAR